MLKAMILFGERVPVGWMFENSEAGDVDITESCDEVGGVDSVGDCEDSGDVDVIDRRDEGASRRKLQVSPFLSQFAHIGCLPSHYPPYQP